MPQRDDQKPQGMAALIGGSFAHLQHGIDRLTEWGFSKMRQIPPEEKSSKTGTLPIASPSRLLRLGRGAVRFLGIAGEEYYKTYEELKKKHKRP